MSTTAHTPVPSLDATIEHFLRDQATQGGPPIDTLVPAEARAVLAGVQAVQGLAVEQAYAATQWVAQNGASIRVDATRLAVAGDGAGGTLAAAVTLLTKERGGPPIAFQVLFYPVTDATFDTASYDQFADGPWLT